MNIKPLADRVLVNPCPAEEVTVAGIIIPDSAKEKPLKGVVLATGNGTKDEEMVVKEGDTLSLGAHTLQFFMAPMVHWPEVMVTYEQTEKILFSADGFGKFGALDADEAWTCEARRYYFNIVGKYGAQVQALLKKAATLDIQMICPLHGPILKEDLGYYIGKYDIWSKYEPEDEGVFIAYASIHGNTAKAAKKLAEMLEQKGAKRVAIADLARDDMAEAVEDAFRHDKLVLASATYDGGLFPCMEDFLSHLKAKNFQKRTVGLMENGTWAPMAAKKMREVLEGMKEITICEPTVTIKSAMKEDTLKSLQQLYVLDAHAADYKVALTDDETAKIEEVAKAFAKANKDEVKEKVSAEYAAEYLRLVTISEKMYDAVKASHTPEVKDEEAAQKIMYYVKYDTVKQDSSTGQTSELSDDEVKKLKKDAKALLDGAKANGNLEAYAKEQKLTATKAAFSVDRSELDEKLVKAADKLDLNGFTDVIVGESAIYVAQVTSLLDKDATEAEKKEIIEERKDEFYKETVEKWTKDTKIKVNDKVWDKISLEGLKISAVEQKEEEDKKEDTTKESTDKAE